MKKKLLTLFMSICMMFGVCGSMTACDLGILDGAIELEDLRDEVDSLKEENQLLKEEIATLKFEAEFPNGLVTESCILNKVSIIRDVANPEGSTYAVRADGSDVEVTINGGTYDAGSGSLYNIAIWAHNGSHIIINDGTFKTGADVNGEANHVIYAAGDSIIEINGGWFESVGVEAPMMINCQDNHGTIIIKGGTFVNFDPSNCISEGEGTSFVAEGYSVIMTEIEGIKYYKVVESSTIQEESSEVEEGPKDF